jgi:hypothetical protein
MSGLAGARFNYRDMSEDEGLRCRTGPCWLTGYHNGARSHSSLRFLIGSFSRRYPSLALAHRILYLWTRPYSVSGAAIPPIGL